MDITKDNYHTATPAQVAEAVERGGLGVPLTAFSVNALLQVIEHIVQLVRQNPGNLRRRVEALESITRLQSAAIQQLLANH